MTTTLEHITTKIISSYSQSLSEKEHINQILDQINEQKERYVLFINQLETLDVLLSQITWLDNLDNADEILIKGIIAMGKEADIHFKKYYATQRRLYASRGWFKEELSLIKESIELHIENVMEVEHIIFELRKDIDFQALSNQIDEL